VLRHTSQYDNQVNRVIEQTHHPNTQRSCNRLAVFQSPLPQIKSELNLLHQRHCPLLLPL